MTGAPTTNAQIGDLSVRYARSGSGPPVVLLHGLAEDHSSWQPVLSGFRNHTAFAVDLRGHGGSSCGHCDGTAEQLARDLTDFLEVVTGPAPVVGFSMGGSIALLGAAERPDMVTGLVVIATSCVVGRAAAEFFSDRISMVESGAMEELATALKEDTATQVLTEVDLDTLGLGGGLGRLGEDDDSDGPGVPPGGRDWEVPAAQPCWPWRAWRRRPRRSGAGFPQRTRARSTPRQNSYPAP